VTSSEKPEGDIAPPSHQDIQSDAQERGTTVSIAQRVLTLVVVCLAIVLAIAAFAWTQMDRVATVAVGLGQSSLPGVQHALEERLSVSEYRAAELRVLSEPNNRPAVLVDLAKARQAVEHTMPSLQASVGSPKEAEAFDAFKTTWGQYVTGSDSAVGMAERKEWDDAWTLLTGQGQQQQVKMHQALEELSRLKSQAADQAVASALDARSRARVVLAVATCLGLALAAALAVLIIKSITRPLRQAVDVAASVAEGDLVRTVVVEGPRELRALLDRLRQMQASLRELVGAVREGSVDIHAISDVVARGNRDLSVRTDQQAGQVSSVVETMSELHAAVTSNSGSARDVGAMVVEASEVARRGGVAVQRVVATMNDIHDASKRIATIVDLTKDIAFQTDILAVNAAVEAARAAGEGRAFAVVASEVRALAKRSAAAAQEIAKLISTSVELVSVGAAEVQEAGRTMDDIVAQVERVSDQMRRIEDSSKAQSNGIAAVDSALHTLSELTHQNLSLVEQTHSASDDLQSRSASLGETVAVFRLTA
jgi:methyl-accepting chemotaxis protein